MAGAYPRQWALVVRIAGKEVVDHGGGRLRIVLIPGSTHALSLAWRRRGQGALQAHWPKMQRRPIESSVADLDRDHHLLAPAQLCAEVLEASQRAQLEALARVRVHPLVLLVAHRGNEGVEEGATFGVFRRLGTGESTVKRFSDVHTYSSRTTSHYSLL